MFQILTFCPKFKTCTNVTKCTKGGTGLEPLPSN